MMETTLENIDSSYHFDENIVFKCDKVPVAMPPICMTPTPSHNPKDPPMLDRNSVTENTGK